MVNLWHRMTEIYGHRWVSQYGDCNGALQTWQKGIADLTRDQIAAGLRACLLRTDPWPPTLPEFRLLCRPPTPPPAHRRYLALPKPSADPERAAAALAEARGYLRGRQP